MADIFGRTDAGIGGAFTSKDTYVVISDVANARQSKLLATNMTLNYTQQVSRIFALESNKGYFVIGRTMGDGTIGHIIGPRRDTLGFVKTLAAGCNPPTILFRMKAGFCEAGRDEDVGAANNIKAIGVICSNFGISVTAQDMLIQSNLALQYSSLEVS